MLNTQEVISMTETMRVYPCDLTAFGECPKCPWERDCSKCGEDVVYEEDDEKED